MLHENVSPSVPRSNERAPAPSRASATGGPDTWFTLFCPEKHLQGGALAHNPPYRGLPGSGGGVYNERGRPVMYQRILVATDGSDDALRAVTTAAEIAAKYGAASLVALHVYELPPVQSAMLGGGMINGVESLDPALFEEWMEELNRSVRAKTETALKAASLPLASFTYRQEIGHPANTIARV